MQLWRGKSGVGMVNNFWKDMHINPRVCEEDIHIAKIFQHQEKKQGFRRPTLYYLIETLSAFYSQATLYRLDRSHCLALDKAFAVAPELTPSDTHRMFSRGDIRSSLVAWEVLEEQQCSKGKLK